MNASVILNGADLRTVCGAECLQIDGHLGFPQIAGDARPLYGRDGQMPLGRSHGTKGLTISGVINGSTPSDYVAKVSALRSLTMVDPAFVMRHLYDVERWGRLEVRSDNSPARYWRVLAVMLTVVPYSPREVAVAGTFTLELICREAYAVACAPTVDGWNGTTEPTWRVLPTGTGPSFPIIEIRGPAQSHATNKWRLVGHDLCAWSNFADSASLLKWLDIYGAAVTAHLYGPKLANELITDWDMEDDAASWQAWTGSTVTKESPGLFGARCVKGVADTGSSNAIQSANQPGLTSGVDYRLAGWVKGNVDVRAYGATGGWWVSNGDGRATATEWMYVEGIFRPATTEAFGVYAEASAAAGTVRIDNVSLMQNLITNGGFASFAGAGTPFLGDGWNHLDPASDCSPTGGKNTCAWATDQSQAFISTGSADPLWHDQITGLTNGAYYLFSFWAKRGEAGTGRVYVGLDGATPSQPWGGHTGDEDGLGCGISSDRWRRFSMPIKMLGTTLDLSFYGDSADLGIVIDDVCLIALEEYAGATVSKKIQTRVIRDKVCVEVSESQALVVEPTTGANPDHSSLLVDFVSAWAFDPATEVATCGMDRVPVAYLDNASAAYMNELVIQFASKESAPAWTEAGILGRTRGQAGYHAAAQLKSVTTEPIGGYRLDLPASGRIVACAAFSAGGDLGADGKTYVWAQGIDGDARQISTSGLGPMNLAPTRLVLAPCGWLRRASIWNKALDATDARRLYGYDDDLEVEVSIFRFDRVSAAGPPILCLDEGETLIIDCEKQTCELITKAGLRSDQTSNLYYTSRSPVLSRGSGVLFVVQDTASILTSYHKRWI